eukprot:4787427-Prymnesium_polylepis.3
MDTAARAAVQKPRSACPGTADRPPSSRRKRLRSRISKEAIAGFETSAWVACGAGWHQIGVKGAETESESGRVHTWRVYGGVQTWSRRDGRIWVGTKVGLDVHALSGDCE